MLASAYRFHSRGGVNAVRSMGKRTRGQEISLITMPNARGKSRVGVVVSKKVLKSAVGRNRVRRRIYAALEPYVPFTTPRDVLVLVQSARVRTMPWPELQAEVAKLLGS